MKEIQRAIGLVAEAFNSSDPNVEPITIVDALMRMTQMMEFCARHLGNGHAMTDMGALEAHGKAMLDAAEIISGSLRDLATAVYDLKR